MTVRDPEEEHRTSTTLELFFDLVFVGAVAAASVQWHHAITSGHLSSLLSYVQVFLGVWWAWMGFTWFANFFDVDDVPYRLLVLLMMFGSLALTAGVEPVFDHHDFREVTLAYVVIRLSMATQWWRAARANPSFAAHCHRWMYGILGCQVLWVAFAFSEPPESVAVPLFILIMAAEMAVPAWAHALGDDRSPGIHREHVQERYGLFTLIVLGEAVLTGSDAFDIARKDTGHLGALVVSAAFALTLAFAMWWLYFNCMGEYDLSSMKTSFIWGYGHYAVFASIAAVGAASSALLSDISSDDGRLPHWGQALALAVPVAVFLVTIAVLKWAGNGVWHPSWIAGAAAVLAVGTVVGSAGPAYALAAVSATTAAFLASEILPSRKAAVPERRA